MKIYNIQIKHRFGIYK